MAFSTKIEVKLLPFLQKKEGSVSQEPEVLKRPENKREVTASLELAMKELFSAQDDKSRALAFKAAFELLEVSSYYDEEQE